MTISDTQVGRDLIYANTYNAAENTNPFIFYGVPDEPNHFVGRDALMEKMVARLCSGESPAFSSEGQGGIGKTTLAVALAYSEPVRKHFSDGVLWVGLGKQANVAEEQLRWGEALGVDLTHKVNRKEVLRHAIGERRMLLIIDDAWDVQSGEHMRCGGPNCCHLLTTRHRDIAQKFARATCVESVGELANEDTYALLQKLAPDVCKAFPQETRDLCDQLGGMPLAVELIGGYLGTTGQNYFKDQQQDSLETMTRPEERLALVGKRLGYVSSKQQTLEQIINLSLEDLDETTRGGFYALGAFASKPEQFDRHAAEVVTGADRNTLARLLDRNLLNIDDKEHLSVHQVLADVARKSLDVDAVTRHRDYYLAVANGDPTNWRRIRDIYAQVSWASQAVKDNAAFIECLRAVAHYLEIQGLWEDAFAWYAQALSVAIKTERSEDEGIILNNVGSIHRALGNKTLALDYCEQALVIFRKTSNHSLEGTTLNNIGLIHHSFGEILQALDCYKQALAICREVGDRSREGTTLNNMGGIYHNLGHIRQALDYYKQALTICKEIGDRILEGTILLNIGGVYDALGDTPRALDYLKRALTIHQEVGDREMESNTRFSIALTYYQQGRIPEAIHELEKTVELERRIQHPNYEQDSARLTSWKKESKT